MLAPEQVAIGRLVFLGDDTAGGSAHGVAGPWVALERMPLARFYVTWGSPAPISSTSVGIR